jgi:hypothetical protein
MSIGVVFWRILAKKTKGWLLANVKHLIRRKTMYIKKARMGTHPQEVQGE